MTGACALVCLTREQIAATGADCHASIEGITAIPRA